MGYYHERTARPDGQSEDEDEEKEDAVGRMRALRADPGCRMRALRADPGCRMRALRADPGCRMRDKKNPGTGPGLKSINKTLSHLICTHFCLKKYFVS